MFKQDTCSDTKIKLFENEDLKCLNFGSIFPAVTFCLDDFIALFG